MRSFLDQSIDQPDRMNLDSNAMSEPSVNMPELTISEPRWREESFQIQPQRAPVTLDTRNAIRPRVSKSPVSTLSPRRVPVLIRSSNQRPVEAGSGTDSEMWSVSDPGAPAMAPWEDGSGAGIPGMGEIGANKMTVGTLVGIAAVIGGMLWWANRK